MYKQLTFFIQKTFLFLIAVIISLGLLFTQADGYTDEYYLKFATPKQKSLILGTSRAAQGVRPDVFEEVLGEKVFNYAFTIGHSPFGDVYLDSIKRKLEEQVTDGTFIITVDPWSISSQTEDPNKHKKFRELELALANTKIVDLKPNFLYLLQNYANSYVYILRNKISHPAFLLHDDGWLEISIGMSEREIASRTKAKLEFYRENNLPEYKFSEVRLDYLSKTIEYLKEHGSVYLVRLPVSSGMTEIENIFMPDFEEKIQQAKQLSSGYLDLTQSDSEYVYSDGNHLFKDSARDVSQDIADFILSQKK